MSIIERSSFDGLVAEGTLSAAARDAKRRGDRQPGNGVVIAQTSSCRVDVCKSLDVAPGTSGLVISHISKCKPGHGMTDAQGKSAAFAACLHLEEFTDYDIWKDGKCEPTAALRAGTLHINDMRHSWLVDIRSAFQVVNFYIPQSALDEIADDDESGRIEELRCPISDGRIDNVVKNMALALLPALIRPDQANRLFVDYAWRAVTAHLARNYGSLRGLATSGRGGLAPWQERRAKEMLLANLSGNLTLPELANACRLSCSHFSLAFRQTVGCPPHQWLLAQRVEKSKELILNTTRSLSEIALETGFSDQSHFTRVFSRRVHLSPAAWRRAQER